MPRNTTWTDPRYIDHLIKGYGTYFGDYFLDASTALNVTFGDDVVSPGQETNMVPVLQSFYKRNSLYGARDTQWLFQFYDRYGLKQDASDLAKQIRIANALKIGDTRRMMERTIITEVKMLRGFWEQYEERLLKSAKLDKKIDTEVNRSLKKELKK